MVIVPNVFFRKTTFEEWNWYVKQMLIYLMKMKSFFSTICCDLFFVNIIGICRLLFEKNGLLPVGKTAKMLIPIAGVLVYLPFFFYFKYLAEHFRLYMSFALVKVLSLILLGLILAGKTQSRKMESKSSGE